MDDLQNSQNTAKVQDDQDDMNVQADPVDQGTAFGTKQKEPFDFASGKQKESELTSVSEGDQLVGGVNEELANRVAKEEGDEYWENYAREIELEKEILEMGGIEKIESGEVPIPEKVAGEMGILPSVGAHTPMATVTGFTVRGKSLSDDQLTAGLTKPTSSGFRWLVEWFIYQLLKAHVVIKRVKSRVVRS